MKPVSLRVEGFASFRERIEIDFSNLDLFAISGATGAGKSSIIDAMTFALYGATPRLGERCTAELIHLSSDRARVLFEFAAGEDLYRIARILQRGKSSIVSRRHLEQYVEGEWKSLASRNRNVRDKVKEIVGLDFGGFNRSIVLPQGQFDQFLKGNAGERRKILSDLLQLDVYERMGRLARQRQRQFEGEIELLDQQIQSRLADIQEGTIEQRNQKVAELEEQSRAIHRDLKQLSSADHLLRKTSVERERKRHLEARVEDLEKECAALREDLSRGTDAVTHTNGLLARLEKERSTLAYDERSHLKLQTLVPRAEALENLRKQRLGAQQEWRDVRRQVDSLEQPLSRLDQKRVQVKKSLAECAGAILEAEAELTELQQTSRADMAVFLRAGLEPDRACPVCTQKVSLLPTPTGSRGHVNRRRPERARSGVAGIHDTGSEADILVATVSRLEGLRRLIHSETERQSDLRLKLEELERARQEARLAGSLAKQSEVACREQLTRTEAELRDLESDLQEWSDLSALRAAIEEQEQHRSDFQEMSRQLLMQDQTLIKVKERADSTRKRLHETLRKLEDCRDRLGQVNGSIAAGSEELERLVAGMKPTREEDPVTVLEQWRGRLEAQLTETSAKLGRLRERLAAARKVKREVRELQKKRAKVLREEQLLRQLALDLKATELVSFIQEEALSRLAADASDHFHDLSSGRYRFALNQGDFSVVDYWNGEEIRKAATLSGGESFLASLSLALALSESLTGYCSTTKRLQLESLFLDEGFSSLDPETLDLVVEGIEALAAGDRMIGVVSHLPQLARRLPSRIQVSKSAEGSTVCVM